MAFEIFKLFGSVFVDNEKANESLSKTDKKAEGVGQKFVKGAKAVGKFGAVVGGVAAAGGAAVIGFSKQMVEMNGEVVKLSQTTGTTTAHYQKLDYAMKQVGFSMEAASGDFSALGEKALDAANGVGEGAELFGILGVEVTDTSGKMKTQGQIFEETIKSLQGMEDITKRNAIASALLGTTGEELVPILNMTNEEFQNLKDNAEIISADDLAQSEKFRKLLTEMQDKAVKFGQKLVLKLLPGLNKFFDWAEENLPKIKDQFGDTFEFISYIAESVAQVLRGELDLSDLFYRVQEWLQEGESGFAQFAAKVVGFLGEFVQFIEDNVKPVLLDLFQWIKDHLPKIKAIFKLAFGVIEAVIKTAWTMIEKFFMPVLKAIWGWIKDHLPEIQAVFEIAFTVIQEVLKIAIDVIEELTEILGGLFDFLANVFIGAGDLIMAAFDGVLDFLGGIAEKVTAVKDAIGGAIEKFKEWAGLEEGDIGFSSDGPSRSTRNMIDVMGLAKGGETLTSGVVKVGERGPENLLLPKGAQVRPLDQMGGGQQVVIQMEGATFVNEQSIGDLLDLMTDYLRGQGVLV